jgi:hypothetical protein
MLIFSACRRFHPSLFFISRRCYFVSFFKFFEQWGTIMEIKFRKLAVATSVFSIALAGVEVQAATLNQTDYGSSVNCTGAPGCTAVQSSFAGTINELGSSATVTGAQVNATAFSGWVPGSVAGPSDGFSYANLTYAIEFAGAPGNIQVQVGASGGWKIDNNAALYGAPTASANLSISGITGAVLTQSTQTAPGLVQDAFGMNRLFSFNANIVYLVSLSAFAETGSGFASAFVDPYFVAPDGYSIILGPGVTNSPPGGVSATPLPAALPLFASGLVAAGLIGWRRKRKVSLAPT